MFGVDLHCARTDLTIYSSQSRTPFKPRYLLSSAPGCRDRRWRPSRPARPGPSSKKAVAPALTAGCENVGPDGCWRPRWPKLGWPSASRRDAEPLPPAVARFVRLGRSRRSAGRQPPQCRQGCRAALYRATHNGFMAEQALAVRPRLEAFRRTQLPHGDRIGASCAGHALMLAAMAEGDGHRAARRMRAYMCNAASSLGLCVSETIPPNQVQTPVRTQPETNDDFGLEVS